MIIEAFGGLLGIGGGCLVQSLPDLLEKQKHPRGFKLGPRGMESADSYDDFQKCVADARRQGAQAEERRKDNLRKG